MPHHLAPPLLPPPTIIEAVPAGVVPAGVLPAGVARDGVGRDSAARDGIPLGIEAASPQPLADMAALGFPIEERRPSGCRRRRFLWWKLPEDVCIVFDKDPAAKNLAEVLLYQGLHALLLHRIAHRLYLRGIPFLPRLISQLGRIATGGIEIHPGARIGRRFFIDHGTGIVIGETTEIGDDVMLYHQVTLGATGWWKDRANGGKKRHPTIGDRVTIGVGASILGPVTIGHDSKIGAMALVIESVPPHSTVVASPARLLHKRADQRIEVEELDYQI